MLGYDIVLRIVCMHAPLPRVLTRYFFHKYNNMNISFILCLYLLKLWKYRYVTALYNIIATSFMKSCYLLMFFCSAGALVFYLFSPFIWLLMSAFVLFMSCFNASYALLYTPFLFSMSRILLFLTPGCDFIFIVLFMHYYLLFYSISACARAFYGSRSF